MKRLAVALAFASVLVVPAQAQPGAGPGGPGAYGHQVVPPDQIVRSGIDRLTGFLLGSSDVSPENLRPFLEVQIAPLFDFDYMARWAASHYWRRLDEAQRGRLAATLEQLFLDALARNLGSYVQPLPRVEVYPARLRAQREARVQARVFDDRGGQVHLVFRFYRSRDGWKAFDVSANGASAVAYYRTYFAQLLRRKGPAALAP